MGASTTTNGRPQTDATIDLKCIAIDVNGLPNSASNPRCTLNNGSAAKDGFVYTSSTYTDDDGVTYKYNYDINKQSGIFSDIIKGAAADDIHRAANAIRSLNTKNEGVINAVSAWAGKQFNGSATKTKDFVYNEGYSTTVGNAQNDKTGINVTGGTSYTITAKDGTTFYDEQTAVYSNQLIAVRNLREE